MTKPSAPAQRLTTAQQSALRTQLKRVHTAGPLHSPESIAAQDALVALVAEIAAEAAAEARDTALLEALSALDRVTAARGAERIVA